MKLEEAFLGVSRLALDTAPIVYFVEANPQYDTLTVQIFRLLAQRGVVVVTSIVTLAEALVRPMGLGDIALQQQYRSLLLGDGPIVTLSLGPAIAEHAAILRARYRINLPDALQVALALDDGCEAFLTNDLRLKRVTELRVLVLDELEL